MIDLYKMSGVKWNLTQKYDKSYKHIIWDWNGTLLDDVDIAVDAMNNLLRRRYLPLLDHKTYKDIFTFPVKDYYEQIGFDFEAEPFEQVAEEFISEYNAAKQRYRLHDGVEKVLSRINDMGIPQSILSASNEQDLVNIVQGLNIDRHFVKLAGLGDYYAASKVDRGKRFLSELELEPGKVLMIGDTVHDYEVSCELGFDCLLAAYGHQSSKRLLVCGVDIIESIEDVGSYLEAIERQEETNAPIL